MLEHFEHFIGIKNCVCTICGKAFNHRSNLVTHMATHSSARPHTCNVCGEDFKLKHTLTKHMLVHTKPDVDKKHQCQFCKVKSWIKVLWIYLEFRIFKMPSNPNLFFHKIFCLKTLIFDLRRILYWPF